VSSEQQPVTGPCWLLLLLLLLGGSAEARKLCCGLGWLLLLLGGSCLPGPGGAALLLLRWDAAVLRSGDRPSLKAAPFNPPPSASTRCCRWRCRRHCCRRCCYRAPVAWPPPPPSSASGMPSGVGPCCSAGQTL
jgi:hypothetical protein